MLGFIKLSVRGIDDFEGVVLVAVSLILAARGESTELLKLVPRTVSVSLVPSGKFSTTMGLSSRN
jgi:hypothetical protein